MYLVTKVLKNELLANEIRQRATIPKEFIDYKWQPY